MTPRRRGRGPDRTGRDGQRQRNVAERSPPPRSLTPQFVLRVAESRTTAGPVPGREGGESATGGSEIIRGRPKVPRRRKKGEKRPAPPIPSHETEQRYWRGEKGLDREGASGRHGERGAGLHQGGDVEAREVPLRAVLAAGEAQDVGQPRPAPSPPRGRRARGAGEADRWRPGPARAVAAAASGQPSRPGLPTRPSSFPDAPLPPPTRSPRRSVITGAGGFIASHLARRLKQEGHWIRACDWKRNEHMSVR